MAVTCARCGASPAEPGDEAPLGWSSAISERGMQHICEACTRDHVRDIEAKLPDDWWS